MKRLRLIARLWPDFLAAQGPGVVGDDRGLLFQAVFAEILSGFVLIIVGRAVFAAEEWGQPRSMSPTSPLHSSAVFP